MAKEKISIDEMKSSDEKKVEECTDEELDEVAGGATTMFPPLIPWTCPSCGHYNNTPQEGNNHIIVQHCVICGQPKPK